MSIEHISKFISEIAVHFAPPKYDTKDQRNAWLASLHRSLDGAGEKVLERAAQIIIDTRKVSRSFPLPAECRAAVTTAADELEFESRMQVLPELREKGRGEHSKDREEFAKTLLKSPVGKEAARGGWVLAVFDFAVREGRMPDNRRYEARDRLEREAYGGCSEIEFCKRAARDFDESYQDALRGEFVDSDGVVREMANAKGLQLLGASMLAKREKLRSEVLGR